MQGLAKRALLAIAIIVDALVPAFGQTLNGRVPPPVVMRGHVITPFGWYVMGSIACAAISPTVPAVVFRRELTLSEAYHTTLGCMLGPVGWLLADAMFPPGVTGPNTQPGTSPLKPRKVLRGRHFNSPPASETRFVNNEVLLEFYSSASAQVRETFARSLQLTQLETQTFTLTGRTIERWRIYDTRPVADTLRLVQRNSPGVSAGQENIVYVGVQTQPANSRRGTPSA
jgi:hypothetical protein